MAEPIKITITDDTGTTQISGGNTTNTQASNKPMNSAAKNNNKSSVLTTASHVALMRAVNYTTSNIGKWTGNSHNQTIVNNVKTMIGYGIAFAVNPVLGAVSVAFDGLTYALDHAYEQRWNNIKERENLVRIGGKGGYRR